MNNLEEIQDKIIKYFSKKGINLIKEYDNLIWNYNIHYSEFSSILRIRKDYYLDEFYLITYNVKGADITTYKKKTKSSSKNFCLIIYKNFMAFQKIFDEKALELKIETDLKKNYCIELTRYYSRLHNKISIDVSEYIPNEININITGYDQRNRHESYYCIKYMNNKYYLISKSDYIKKDFDLTNSL